MDETKFLNLAERVAYGLTRQNVTVRFKVPPAENAGGQLHPVGDRSWIIDLNPGLASMDRLYKTLLHEIAHIVTKGGAIRAALAPQSRGDLQQSESIPRDNQKSNPDWERLAEDLAARWDDLAARHAFDPVGKLHYLTGEDN